MPPVRPRRADTQVDPPMDAGRASTPATPSASLIEGAIGNRDPDQARYPVLVLSCSEVRRRGSAPALQGPPSRATTTPWPRSDAGRQGVPRPVAGVFPMRPGEGSKHGARARRRGPNRVMRRADSSSSASASLRASPDRRWSSRSRSLRSWRPSTGSRARSSPPVIQSAVVRTSTATDT